MNAVEIEEAVSGLVESEFDPAEFPFAFLRAFGNKETTIKRLRDGATNRSDVGGVLQRNHIHLAVCDPGGVSKTLESLRDSKATQKAKAKFILATDGEMLEAEDLIGGETLACSFRKLADHFGFFLALAGITTVKAIRENAFDIKATARLNRLYVEILRDNPDWAEASRQDDLNHFIARLVFCFFAEDTSIFSGALFSDTVTQMSQPDSSNTHEIIGEIFRAMNTPPAKRAGANLRRWACTFPYVNGGLFAGDAEVPRFSRVARSYLIHIGSLDWARISPDIFGSMIQVVASDSERGQLGMHYTSVPNILKLLNPLFLDDFRAQLEAAGDNPRKLLNLRKRIACARVCDPACGSGNFLVIAYKELRLLEHEINIRRGEPGRKSDIRLTNFRGIEIRSFSAEIARLSLIISEYQCNVQFLGQREALIEFLPLESDSWITCGNALHIDWFSLWPSAGVGTRLQSDDLFGTPLDQAEIDFENAGGETFICGNPPYIGSQRQSEEQKSDIGRVLARHTNGWRSLDLVSAWLIKAAEYGRHTQSSAAFVATNTICQGRHVATLWPPIFEMGAKISFAHTSFKWANLAAHNAGVTVVIVGISHQHNGPCRIYSEDSCGKTLMREADFINAYLAPDVNVVVSARKTPIAGISEMSFGSMPNDGGHLLLGDEELAALNLTQEDRARFVRRFAGSAEFIRGLSRYCLWIADADVEAALSVPAIKARIEATGAARAESNRPATQALAAVPHRFGEVRQIGGERTIIVPGVSSENRAYLPVGLLPDGGIVSNLAFGLFDAPLWNLALIGSRLHLVWIAAVCGKLETRYRYSNTLGWNTFPVPALTSKNKGDLTRCAEDILLAREQHFPKTIAELYAADEMPAALKAAHHRNDELLERIYIGRRFRNDTERLEKLFAMYAEMTSPKATGQ